MGNICNTSDQNDTFVCTQTHIHKPYTRVEVRQKTHPIDIKDPHKLTDSKIEYNVYIDDDCVQSSFDSVKLCDDLMCAYSSIPCNCWANQLQQEFNKKINELDIGKTIVYKRLKMMKHVCFDE